MPCSDARDNPSLMAQILEQKISDLNDQLGQTRRVNVTWESLLCSACRTLERFGYDFDENPALSQWWSRHKKLDALKKQ